ncbi:MAG: VCBS repeat-containing protein [Kiritimatiellia bacterium]
MLATTEGDVVAFAGGKGRSGADALVFYMGGEGRWQQGRILTPGDATTPAQWSWTTDLDKTMYGTFNGHPGRLADMMRDRAKNRAFFPSRPFDQFKADLTVDTFDKPVQGVAMFDFNADGKPDIYAASGAGGRLYLQGENLAYIDSTRTSGLEGVKGVSVSAADVNLDGSPDLLIDGKLFLQDEQGVFHRSADLSSDADQDVKMAAFVDLNQNGYPDIVVSKIKGGLHAYLNQADKAGPFTDATSKLGLDSLPCGSDQSGFFIPGDWDGNGKASLFFSVKRGLLLVQGADGKYSPRKGVLPYDFSGPDGEPTLTGAGSFAPIWMPDSPDFVFATNSVGNILSNVKGKAFDGGKYGNEIVVSTTDCLAAAAEDLNADGRVDIYTISRKMGSPNGYYLNRGYGSFMASLRYKPAAIPGPAHQQGALGVAIGDMNGDGANDILLGGTDGTLTLLINDTLSLREPRESSTAQDKVLEQTGIVSVRAEGPKGLTGARITLVASDGRTVAVRILGSNVVTGCQSPNTVNLAVREPGEYRISIRYSDGHTQEKPITLKPSTHFNFTMRRVMAD